MPGLMRKSLGWGQSACSRGLKIQSERIFGSSVALSEGRTQEICSMLVSPVLRPVRRYSSAASTASLPIDTCAPEMLLLTAVPGSVDPLIVSQADSDLHVGREPVCGGLHRSLRWGFRE